MSIFFKAMFRRPLLIVSFLSLITSVPWTPVAATERVGEVTRLLNVAHAYYWFGLAEQGNPSSFNRGIDYLARAREMLKQLEKGNITAAEVQGLSSSIEALQSDLDEQLDIAHDTLFGVFPMARFLGPSLFADPTSTSTFELIDDPEVIAVTSAAENLMSTIVSELKTAPQLVVSFSSIPQSRALENEVLYIFNTSGKFFVETRRDLVQAIYAQASSPIEASAWLDEFDNGSPSAALISALMKGFDAEWFLLITVRKVESAPNDHFYILNGRVFQSEAERPVFSTYTMGFSRDRGAYFAPIILLNVALLAAAILIASYIRQIRFESFSKNFLSKAFLFSALFMVGRAVPWFILPTVRTIMPAPENLAILSFWWVTLIAFTLFVLPIIVARVLYARLASIMPIVDLDRQFGEASIAISIGIVAFLLTPAMLYLEWQAIPLLVVLLICVAAMAFLLGCALDRQAVLPVGLAVLPASGLSLVGTAFFHADIVVAIAAILITTSAVYLMTWHTAGLGWVTGVYTSAKRDQTKAIDSTARDPEKLRESLDNPPFVSTPEMDGIVDAINRHIKERKMYWLEVCGAAGVGKSATIQNIVDRVAPGSGAITLEGRCTPVDVDGKAPSYGPIQDAFSNFLGIDLSAQQAGGELHGAIDLAYDALMGPFAAIFDFAGDPSERSQISEDDLLAFFEQRLRRVAKKRIVILTIDDAQWIDDSSRSFLERLFVRLSPGVEVPFLVVLASRETGTLSGLASPQTKIYQLNLPFWNEERSRKLLEDNLSLSPETSEWVWHWASERLSSKTPQDILDTSLHLLRGGHLSVRDGRWSLTSDSPELPNSQREYVRQIIDAYPEERGLIIIASVLGKEFEASYVARVLQVPELDVLGRLDRLEAETGLFFDVFEKDDLFSFRSQMALDAVREEFSVSFDGPHDSNMPQSLRLIHGEIGLVLAQLDNPSITDLQRKAMHFYASGKRYANDAVSSNLEAARAARSLCQFDQAYKNLKNARAYVRWVTNEPAIKIEELLIAGEQSHVENKNDLRTKFVERVEEHLQQSPEDLCRLGVIRIRAYYELAASESVPTTRQIKFSRVATLSRELQTAECNAEIKIQAMQFEALSLPADQIVSAISLLRDALSQTLLQDLGQALWAKIADSLAGKLIAQSEASSADIKEARSLFEQSITIKELDAISDRKGLAISKNQLGRLLLFQLNDLDAAQACFEESLHHSQGIGDVAGIAKSMCHLGQCAQELRDTEAARGYFRSCIDGQSPRIDTYFSYIGLMEVAIEDSDWAALSSLLAEILTRSDYEQLEEFLKIKIADVLQNISIKDVPGLDQFISQAVKH